MATKYVIQSESRYPRLAWKDHDEFDDAEEARDQLRAIREGVGDVIRTRLIARTEVVLDEF